MIIFKKKGKMQLGKDVYKLEFKKKKDSQIIPYQENILFRNSLYSIFLQIYVPSWTGLALSRKFSCNGI